MLKKLPMILLLSTVICTSDTLAVSPAPTCDETLTACDKALTAREEELRLCDLGVKMLKERNGELEKEKAEMQRSASALYKNPFFLIAIGLVAGVALTR